MAKLSSASLDTMVLLIVASCGPTPMRWERSGAADAAQDEVGCRSVAHQEAIRRLPYGDGPPIFGMYREMSMLQWQQAIDNERYHLEVDLTKVCMSSKGYQLVPIQGES